jgi:hypothetical protein
MKRTAPSHWRSASRILIVFTVALTSVSCAKSARKSVFPVSGQVRIDGKPIPHAFVVFHPQGVTGADDIRPHAQADADGSFLLSTYDSTDGAPVGAYRITVEKYKAPTEADRGPPLNLLPTRYAKPDTSNLTAHVQQGQNELPPFQLKR